MTPAPATTPKQPAMPAPTPAVPEPESLKAAPPPLTFSNKMMHFKPAAEASDQPNLAAEEQKSESTAKDKEGDNFIKKFVEYLMKLIQSQLEEEEQKRKQQGEGSSFGSSLASIDPQQGQDQDYENTKKFNSPRPKPAGKSMEEELKELLKEFDGSTDKELSINKQHNLGITNEKLQILQDFATAFSPNEENDSAIATQKNGAQDRLKGAFGEEPVNAINELAQNDSGFKENLGQFAQNLRGFLKNPTLKNGMNLANSASKIANPLAKTMSGVGVGQTDDLNPNQKPDPDKLNSAGSQDPSQEKSKHTKSPFELPSTRRPARPTPPSGGGTAS